MQSQQGIWKRFIISLLVVDRCSLSWDPEEVYYKIIWGGQMQAEIGIWKRFIRNLLGVDRCSLSWGSGRGLLGVYLVWTDAASAGDLEEVY